jgi:predicted transposase YbfD/YdcC
VHTAHTTDKGHGRLERREIVVVDSSSASFNIPGIQQVAQITRERTNLRTNKTTTDKVLLITNLSFQAANAEELLWMNRFYWQIENGLHYHKDLVFGEDRSTIRTKHGPANMATLRNFAIGVLLSNNIGNIKRCVDNLKYNPRQLLRLAA